MWCRYAVKYVLTLLLRVLRVRCLHGSLRFAYPPPSCSLSSHRRILKHFYVLSLWFQKSVMEVVFGLNNVFMTFLIMKQGFLPHHLVSTQEHSINHHCGLCDLFYLVLSFKNTTTDTVTEEIRTSRFFSLRTCLWRENVMSNLFSLHFFPPLC